MPYCGIIAEYNPFHNGHALHIARTKTQTDCPIIAVMSGNFVQRGEPALLAKRKRAEMALYGGVDLVLELPLPWAVAPAESFARGGVSILKALGCVDGLSFGCETDDINALQSIAAALLCEEYDHIVRALLPTGATFARLRMKALAQMGIDPQPLATPNNTLAVEYLKANLTLEAGLQPVAIRRFGAAHDDDAPADSICSASYLRNHLTAIDPARYMPETAHLILQTERESGRAPASLAALEQGILTVLRRMTPEDMEALPDVSEGLHNRLFAAVQSACTVEEIMEKTKTKRYPLARIRRLILSACLNIPAGYAEQTPPYLRVLGFNRTGREILATARKTATLPLITRYADIRKADDFARTVFALECRAGDLHGLATPVVQPCAQEQLAAPVYR